MFSLPSTPAVQTRSAARSRYNSDTSPAHSQSFPPPVDPLLSSNSNSNNNNNGNHTPSATPTRARDHTDSVSSIRSTDHHHNTTSPSLSATIASPTQTVREGYTVQTPFVQHAQPPSLTNTPQQASPTHMPGYHPDTPSPPAQYGGINGANIVVGDSQVMPSSTGVACQPLGGDVFSSAKSQNRPALRPSHSHNGAIAPNSFPSWSRRIVADDININTQPRAIPAPISVGHCESQPLALSATYPNTPLSGQGSVHDSSAPFSASSHPVSATHPSSAYPPPPPSHQHSSSHNHTQPISIGGTPYSDQELSFQSSAYGGSYDSSFGSNSPWTPQSADISGHHYHHPYYAHVMSNKLEEPILAPGEVPAPRPPMSYAALIGEALLLAPPPHQLYVSEISDSIKKRYAYYRQNPTKVYNGVRHQTSMCKAFVKLPRPFGDQSGGARKWAIRAGCETWFQGGGYHPPGSNAAANMKKASPPPTSSHSNNNGKAKQTARSKQLAIGTSTSSSSSHSPKPLSNKIKTEPYIPSLGGGPSVGPAYDGSGKPYYPAYGHASVSQYNHYGNQQPQGGYYSYQPIAYGHGYAQPPQWGPSPYGASNQPPAPGSPEHSHSPQVSASGYHGYPYPLPYSQQGMPSAHSYAAPAQGDYKPYQGMFPPHHAGPGFPQSDERPNTQGSHGSQASYDGKLSPDTGDRANSVELSPRH